MLDLFWYVLLPTIVITGLGLVLAEVLIAALTGRADKETK